METPKTPGAHSALSREEYRSLRATVQRRGNIRVVMALTTWSVWAVLATLAWTTGRPPMAGLIPLIVLAGGFEVVLSLHAGVERIGRYIQVAFEAGVSTPPAWEHVAMGMGNRWLSPGGLDPLFSSVFLIAAATNALPALTSGSTAEVVAAVVVHLGFAIRVILAKNFVRRQRAHDLKAVQQVILSNPLVSRIQQER